jgi:hypothetical protein
MVQRTQRIRELLVIGGGGDRHAAARHLVAGWRAGDLRNTDLIELIPDIWVRLNPPAGPYGPLTDDEWLELFSATGFFVGPPRLPFEVADPVQLFRAAPVERSRGMSWCTHRRMAEGFVPKGDRSGGYKIWTAQVPKSGILAAVCRPDDVPFDLPQGEYREIIVDPAALPAHLDVS